MNATTPFSVRRSRSSRSGPPAARSAAASISAASTSSPAPASRERLEVGLHRRDLRDGADDRALDLLGDVMRLVEREVARELQVERDLGVAPERDDAQIVDLTHAAARSSRLRARGPERRLVARGSTWTTTSLPGSASSSSPRPGPRPHAPGRRRRPAAPRSRRRRTSPRGLPETKPRQLDRRLDPRDRRARRLLGLRRRAVHEHVHVSTDQATGGEQHESGDEERCNRVTRREAGARRPRPARTASVPAKSLPKWIAFERRASLRNAGRAERDDGATEVDRQDDPDDREEPPAVSTSWLGLPVSRVTAVRRPRR